MIWCGDILGLVVDVARCARIMSLHAGDRNVFLAGKAIGQRLDNVKNYQSRDVHSVLYRDWEYT